MVKEGTDRQTGFFFLFFLDSSLQSRRLCSEGNASFYCWDVGIAK